jgi:hypothetical protein
MPSLLTHGFFADDFSYRHQSEPGFLPINPDAFRLGAEGPDPLFFYGSALKRGFNVRIMKENIGTKVHHSDAKQLIFLCFRQLDKMTRTDDVSAFSAFILGQIAHYFLDAACHPYVFYWSGFDDHGRLKGKYHYAHGHFESCLDSALAHLRAQENLISAPWEVFSIDSEKMRVISENFTAALEGFVSHPLPQGFYMNAVYDMSDMYRHVNTAGPFRKTLMGHSIFSRIYLPRGPEGKVLNDSHLVWKEPVSGKDRNEDFEELFSSTLFAFNDLYQDIRFNGFSYEVVVKHLKGLDYYGKDPSAVMVYKDAKHLLLD